MYKGGAVVLELAADDPEGLLAGAHEPRRVDVLGFPEEVADAEVLLGALGAIEERPEHVGERVRAQKSSAFSMSRFISNPANVPARSPKPDRPAKTSEDESWPKPLSICNLIRRTSNVPEGKFPVLCA